MESREVLRAIWKRRLLVVLVVVATTAVSIIFAVSKAPKYESVSTLALTPSTEGGELPPETLEVLLGTYAQTAKSSVITQSASRILGEPLPGSVGASSSAGIGIMKISGTAETADDAALVAKTVSNAFIKYLAENSLVQPEIVDPAAVPSAPVQPRPSLIIAIGIFLGLIAGALLAYFVEQFRRRIESTADIVELTSVPVIGVLPNQRRLSRGSSRLIWGDDDLEALQESFRALRTNIEFQVGDRRAVIQVTSPVAGEGKSTIVANLGVALAQLGIETLIVDADLRQPAQHEIFNLANDAGLSSALRGKFDSKLRRVPTEYPRLSVLPSGPVEPNTTEMLHVRAAPLLETFGASGALVLIDSPPVLPVSDARIIARHADAVLLTVAAGKEKPSALTSAIEILHFAGASISGIVLNRADDTVSGGYGSSLNQPSDRGASPQIRTAQSTAAAQKRAAAP